MFQVWFWSDLSEQFLKIVYESLFWSREKSEGGIVRPLLVVMEEAHRYLSSNANGLASETVKKIAKEGRKYGVGAMIISQRPSEVDETILSQCGTIFCAPSFQSGGSGTCTRNITRWPCKPVGCASGSSHRRGHYYGGGSQAAQWRCRITLPSEENRPRSTDPKVSQQWSLPRRVEGYERVVASWRAQRPRAVLLELSIERRQVDDEGKED